MVPFAAASASAGVLGSLVAGTAALPPSPTLTANPFKWPTFLSRLAKPAAAAAHGTSPGGPFLAEMAAEVQVLPETTATPAADAKAGGAAARGVDAGGLVQRQRWRDEEVEAGVMEAVAGGRGCQLLCCL